METRALLYYASIAVGGALMGWWGVSGLRSGDGAVFGVLFTVSGSGTVLAAAYEVVASDDRSENVPDDRTVRVVAGFALLGVLGLLLETVA